MFTGLIEDVGALVSLKKGPDGWKLALTTSLPLDEVGDGDSIAVNGACLTVEQRQPAAGIVQFHALRETLERSNLRQLLPGSPVNLERALRLGDRLGGHMVSGHIDACVPVRSLARVGPDLALSVDIPEAWRAQVIEKGSVALNGVSLTVASLDGGSCSVRLIPETWKRSNLRFLSADAQVNLETDMMGKYVQRLVDIGASAASAGPSMTTLNEAGFLS